jgi:hypothetical protein
MNRKETKMTEPIDNPQYDMEEMELARRIMCAHISIIQDKSYEECWNQYVEPAERIEDYYLNAGRNILKSYAEDHEKGNPEAAGRIHKNRP